MAAAADECSFEENRRRLNVDVVLGMDWLAQWDPVIDWRRQVMHIWVNRQWDRMSGELLESTQQARTVKVFDGCYASADSQMSDWVIMKTPKLWCLNTDQNCTINK